MSHPPKVYRVLDKHIYTHLSLSLSVCLSVSLSLSLSLYIYIYIYIYICRRSVKCVLLQPSGHYFDFNPSWLIFVCFYLSFYFRISLCQYIYIYNSWNIDGNPGFHGVFCKTTIMTMIVFCRKLHETQSRNLYSIN